MKIEIEVENAENLVVDIIKDQYKLVKESMFDPPYDAELLKAMEKVMEYNLPVQKWAELKEELGVE